jgi:hypothetical protein
MLDKLDTVCLSRELAALLLVAIATRIDSGLHNRPDMIQSQKTVWWCQTMTG